MKKLLLFLAAIFTATVMNLQAEPITVRLKASSLPAGWGDVAIYYWNGETSGWPGEKLTAVDGWYTKTFKSTTTSISIIWNNNDNGKQTGNIQGITSSTCYEINGGSGTSHTVATVDCPAPDMHDFLYFVGLNGNDTVKINKIAKVLGPASLTATFEYSKNRINWTAYDTWAKVNNTTYQGNPIALAKGDTIFFRAKGKDGKNATLSYMNDFFKFVFGADDSIAAGGNPMSLYDATCEQDTMTEYGFTYLFSGAKQLVSVSELKLPATKLAKGCYAFMFNSCKTLTQVPELKATQLAEGCYASMFSNCYALTQAPELKATQLATSCYNGMFGSCTALTQAPALPATTLAPSCYSYMFKNCTSLTQAPALPATTLPKSCYGNMFFGCTSLTDAPELKATTLAEYCYDAMFKNCSKLEVNAFSVSCDGAELVVPDTTAAPTDWNRDMFTGCHVNDSVKIGGHYCIRKYGKPLPPDMHDFLYFTSLKADGTGIVKLNKKASIETLADVTATFEYSKDRKTWTEYTWGDWISSVATGAAIALNQGDTVFFRALGAKKDGKNATVGYGENAYFRFLFGVDDSIAAGGNVMSLYDAKCEQDTMTEGGFYNLFSTNPSLVSVSELKLPAKKMAKNCYYTMFEKCTSLTTAPELPATTLPSYCYQGMFNGCSALTQAPAVLPATTLAYQCCYQMFQNCTALTVAPALPATKIAERCYACMFEGCTSLTAAPELKADSMANLCYYKMFSGCTSLQVDTCADGNCDGAKLEPTHSGTGEPTSWSKKMFEGCHGAYANNIQLNGHYCIQKYVEPVCQIGTKGYESIAAAVAEVQAGETIQVLKDIQLDAVIDVTSSTPACTLDLNGHILDGSNLDNQSLLYNASTLYIIDSNPTATHAAPFDTIAGAIMTGGNGWNGGSYSYGGAIYNYNNGTLYMNGVAFVNNTADYGGAIYNCNNGTLYMNGVAFVNNTADYGGGVYSYQAASTFKNCRFYGNMDTQYGAALFINSNTCSIDSCIFQENASYCGIIYGNKQAVVNVNGSTFVKDSASYGGAAYFYQATSTFKNCRFNGNKGTYGGAVYFDNSTSTLTNCRFDGNDAPYAGAAWVDASQCAIDSCVIKNNSAQYDILRVRKAALLTIAHTTITDNTSTGYAGAIGMYGGSLTLNDGTVITNNTSIDNIPNGGVYVWNQSDYSNAVTLSGKVIIKDNTTNGEPANLCLSGEIHCDTVTLNGLSEGSEIHVCTMINDSVAPTTFAANATEADLQYFVSDNGYAFVLNEGMIASKEAYGRKVTKGNYGTICLDKKFIAMEGVEALYVPSDKDKTTLYCSEVKLDSVKAGGAYIFKANADSVTFVLEGDASAAVAAAINNDHMIGWLADDYTLAASDTASTGAFHGYYLLGTPAGASEQQIVKPEPNSQILKNRAFIDLAKVLENTGAMVRVYKAALRINGTSEATGLENAEFKIQNAECKMLINGQLIIIKDGVKYNAMGQKME